MSEYECKNCRLRIPSYRWMKWKRGDCIEHELGRHVWVDYE